MDSVEAFLTANEELEVVNAIMLAEKTTSGEIRVHLEKTCTKPVLERAKEVFYQLNMDKTQLQNGVLLYVATESKHFAILGDKGIHEKVSEHFWQDETAMALQHFSQKQNALGLIKTIEKVGEKLKVYFPYQREDADELSNEISKSL